MAYKVFEGKPKFGKPMYYISEMGERSSNTKYSPNKKYLERIADIDNEYKTKAYKMVKAYKERDISVGDSLSKELSSLREKRSKVNRGIF